MLGPMQILVARVYDASPAPGSAPGNDGSGELRLLIDRLWPRGVSKDAAAWDHWCKTIAPSTELRKWFGHDPAKFAEFTRRYQAELDANANAVQELRVLIKASKKQTITLLYAAKDTTHNHAPVLAAYLQERAGR